MVKLSLLASSLAFFSCGPIKKYYGLKQHDLENIVLNESQKNKVVMFGEKHGEYSKDSDFVKSILPFLKKQGFNYLALEIVKNPRTHLQIGKNWQMVKDYIDGKIELDEIPEYLQRSMNSGIKGWVGLAKAAKKLDIKVVCYDPNKEEYGSFNEREIKAFNNIKEDIFDKDPEAKILVYCGNLHIAENETDSQEIAFWERWNELGDGSKGFFCLGYHLDKYTKGKNLTVNISPELYSEIEYDMFIDTQNIK